ncbi:MAG: histidine--tRNA ligase [Myxococcota bacterium]
MGKQSTKPPKGTRDFLGPELVLRHRVIRIIQEVYESFGFEPLETPSFERLDTLLGKYGDEGDQLVFKILHRAQHLVTGVREAAAALAQPGTIVVGRTGETAPSVEPLLADLGLRYDLTVPLARVVAQYRNQLPPVYRRYQIQPVWRADTPSKARFREFHQCDVDVAGSCSPLVEVEVVSAVSTCLARLGFDAARVRVNHRGLLRSVMRVAGVPSDLEVTSIVALDKLDKMGPDGVRAELAERGIEAASAERLLGVLDARETLDSVGAFVAQDEEGVEAVANLRRILELAQGTAAGERLLFSATLARGLGYYTGAIFEVEDPGLGASLGGGGRYDGLVGMFSGKDVPACGFSLGLERILVLLQERGGLAEDRAQPRVLLAATQAGASTASLELARALRDAGFAVSLAPDPLKAARARKEADERGYDAAVLVGEGEGLGLWLRSAPGVRDRRASTADAVVAAIRAELSA